MGLRDLARAHLETIGNSRTGVCPASGHLRVVRTGQIPDSKILPDKSDNPDTSDVSDKPDKSIMVAGQYEADRRNTIAKRQGSTDRYCFCGKLSECAWSFDGRREVWRCFACLPVDGRA